MLKGNVLSSNIDLTFIKYWIEIGYSRIPPLYPSKPQWQDSAILAFAARKFDRGQNSANFPYNTDTSDLLIGLPLQLSLSSGDRDL